MANGFCPSLLLDINDIAGGNSPARKAQVVGMLAMLLCCQDSAASPLNDAFQGGHKRNLTVKYRQRPTVDMVQSQDDCDINSIPAYGEWTFPALMHQQVSFFLPEDSLRQYCADASQLTTIGRTQVMREVYDLFIEYANVLAKKVNQSIVAAQGTSFGVNASTGASTATTVNIPKTTAGLDLNSGIIKLLQDIENNEICGEVCLVGGGNFAAYDKAAMIACCSAAGIDISKAGIPSFYFDKDSQTVWGANSLGVFAQGSAKLVQYDKYVGNFAGIKGGSEFFNVTFPTAAIGCGGNACLNDFSIDVQMKYIDCPQSVTVNGVDTPVGRGWQVILSKDYGYFVQPVTGYADGDPLKGANGTILYTVTNT